MRTTPVILVIDDEERNLRLMQAMLTPMGYQIETVGSGREGLEQAYQDPPDVVLLDVMMPGMDGYEVARRLRADDRTRRIPLVMVTALSSVEDRIRALNAGADDFLSKPFDKAELHARVRSLLKVKAYNDHMENYQQILEQAVAEHTQKLQQALKALKQASLETIFRLCKASEYKDEDTGAHIKRMSNYSAAVARSLGLKEKNVERILYAAPMHDIGKIGIPDKILLKPGKLDPQEWEIMKQHTVIGGQILEGATLMYLPLARIIAMSHHEKWDGTGYPRGLSGKDIPLVGRIVALADVFDALTTQRPYKQAFSVEKSFGIIREGRGTHFDPRVVDAFFSIADDILAIKARYQDANESLFFQIAKLAGEETD